MLHAKKTFILVSFTICVIGLIISGSQYALIHAYNESNKATKPEISPTHPAASNENKAHQNTAETNSENPFLELHKQSEELADQLDKSQKQAMENSKKTFAESMEIINKVEQEQAEQWNKSQQQAMENINRIVAEGIENNNKIMKNSLEQAKQIDSVYED